MGYVAYSFESLAPPDILFRHIEDEEHYLRHLDIFEKAMGTTIPRDYQVLEKVQGRMGRNSEPGIMGLKEENALVDRAD